MHIPIILLLTIIHWRSSHGAFSSFFFPTTASNKLSSSSTNSNSLIGNVLIMDHLNINHEKGRHDLINAFYFEFLQCLPDPRKLTNLQSGSKTLWANIGSHQFHLPEGKPNAQIFQGRITLSYPCLDTLKERYNDIVKKGSSHCLFGTQFTMVTKEENDRNDDDDDEVLFVTDPWGTPFRLILDTNESDRDTRGSQPTNIDDNKEQRATEGCAMKDLTVYTPMQPQTNFDGIGRFYQHILGAPVLSCDSKSYCTIAVGPRQTLTFMASSTVKDVECHTELDDVVLSQKNDKDVDSKNPNHSLLLYPSNYGPHISMYVANFRKAYRAAEALGVTYVNPRFKRRAYTEEEAVDDCMFRCLDIVDPENLDDGIILKLEHEIRSVVKRDGSKYKSCPFDEIPKECQE